MKTERMFLLNPIEKAMQLLEKQEVDQALKILDKEKKTASADTQLTIATVYVQWGFLQEAEELLIRLHEQYPDETEIVLMLAEVSIEVEKDEQALHLLEDIPATDELYAQVLLQLADIYQAQGLFEVAEMKLTEAKEIAPKEIILDFALAEFYFSIGSYNNAISYYEAILLQEKEIAQVSIYERLAEANASIGAYEKAFQMYEHVDSFDVDFLFKQGFATYKSNRLEVAISIWKKIIEIDPHYSVVYSYIAKTYQELHRIEDARKYIEEGLQYDEYNKELHYIAARIADELGAIDQRNTHIQTAIELDPEYTEAVLFYLTLLKDEEDYEAIVEFTSTLEQQNIEEPLYTLERARAFIALEMYTEARKEYDNVAIHFKSDAPFLKEYSFFLIEEGEREQAKTMLEAYVALEPLDEESIEMLNRITEDELE